MISWADIGVCGLVGKRFANTRIVMQLVMSFFTAVVLAGRDSQNDICLNKLPGIFAVTKLL